MINVRTPRNTVGLMCEPAMIRSVEGVVVKPTPKPKHTSEPATVA